MTAPGPPREPYDLRDPSGTSDRFYRVIAELADRTSMELERAAAPVLDEYSSFCATVRREEPRSRSEYGVELLTLGLVRWRYACATRQTPRLVVVLASWLYSLRSHFPRFKGSVDVLRGWILGAFFVRALRREEAGREERDVPWRRRRTGGSCFDANAEFDALVRWLAATGEFKEECLRLESWRAYLQTMPSHQAWAVLMTAARIFATFQKDAERLCGGYTACLKSFQERCAPAHRRDEDALLVSKSAAEYHLNMVAAELMNRGMRRGFCSTRERVVLVPGCMRARSDAGCRAVARGCDIECGGCDDTCQVMRLRNLGRRDGFLVRIVPHSTSFTRWLERYRASSNTGIIPVACPLHLVAGGYEVRRLGLRAQCVLLDYCGCKRHWHAEGIPTAANERQVKSIATQQNVLVAESPLP